MLRELALLSRTQPNPAYSSTCSAVSAMLTLEDFEAALERARKNNRLVVIKFYQAAQALEPPLGTRLAPDPHPATDRLPSSSPCPDQARCKACLNARAPYEKAAKGTLAERADFYEVRGATPSRFALTLCTDALPVRCLISPPTPLPPSSGGRERWARVVHPRQGSAPLPVFVLG